MRITASRYWKSIQCTHNISLHTHSPGTALVVCLFPSTLLMCQMQECCVTSSAHLTCKEQKLVSKPHCQTCVYVDPELRKKNTHYSRNSETVPLWKLKTIVVLNIIKFTLHKNACWNEVVFTSHTWYSSSAVFYLYSFAFFLK